MDGPIALPVLAGAPDADGWRSESTRYRLTARPKPKFRSVIDIGKALDGGVGRVTATMRTREPDRASGGTVLELHTRVELARSVIEDKLSCIWDGGVRAAHLSRNVGDARRKEIDFLASPFALPSSTYPEVLLPFLLRAQPRDGARRALYAWTSDRFIARVYYESRHVETITTPAGRFAVTPVWLYPDLNDWIALGGVVTRLVKPFLPRYEVWIENAAPHRVVRFEGAYGPPGAPELVLELDT